MPPLRSERKKARAEHHTTKKLAIFDLRFGKRSIFQGFGFASFPRTIFKGIEIRSHIEKRPGGIRDGQVQRESEIVHTAAPRIGNIIGKRRPDDRFAELRLRIDRSRRIEDDKAKPGSFLLQQSNGLAKFFGSRPLQVGAFRSAIQIVPGDVLETRIPQIQGDKRKVRYLDIGRIAANKIFPLGVGSTKTQRLRRVFWLKNFFGKGDGPKRQA